MFIEFGKVNMILTLITSFFTILMKKNYYGYIILTYCLMIGFHLLCIDTLKNEKFTKYTIYPAYITLFILIIISFYVLYKSKSTIITNKLISVSQLLLALIFMLILKYGKSKFEILNENFINYIPSLFFIGFLISVSIIKDNQLILRKTYSENMYKLRNIDKRE